MVEFEKIYVITMWSGGRPSKKWKTLQYPELLPQGTGIQFTCMETKLTVQLIGSISIEEYEQGMAIPEWPGEIATDPGVRNSTKKGSIFDDRPDSEGLL